MTPTDYQAGVQVELDPSHMTAEAGLVLVGSWNLSFASAELEGASVSLRVACSITAIS